MLLNNPKLYEINTRVWIRKFDEGTQKANLKNIPVEAWSDLKEKGIDVVWLMGVWKSCSESVPDYCFKDYLVKGYQKALRDYCEEDVIGSPFAIDEYVVNPALGNFRDLKKVREDLNSKGMKLFLDFIPNHFSANTKLLKKHPEIFLPANKDLYANDKYTYFKLDGAEKYFCHGRDPFFPPWEDTVQVNYFSKDAFDFMVNTLLNIAEYCDGVRCDMAMLALDNVFYNTWSGILNRLGFQKPQENFWHAAISKVKEKFPDFTFIAEVYWDLEWDLQQLGFDYTYDKKLIDRLAWGDVTEIKLHLLAEEDYQKRSVRFIENHDEERAIMLLGKPRSLAAAVIISTIQGMHFYYDGQFEGRRTKLPVQLGRQPLENNDKPVYDFYMKLLQITKDEIFKTGLWKMLDVLPSWETNLTYKNILAWNWKLGNENRLVVVNYSSVSSQCRIKIDTIGFDETFKLTDLLHDTVYQRSTEDTYHEGLFVDLKPFQSHIFAY